MRPTRPQQPAYKKSQIWWQQSKRAKQKLWRAIDGMSKELQELVHGDASTDGVEPVLASINPIEEGSAPKEGTSIAPQSIPLIMESGHSFFLILGERRLM